MRIQIRMHVCGGYFVSTQSVHTGWRRHMPKVHVRVHVCVGGTTWSACTGAHGCGRVPQLPTTLCSISQPAALPHPGARHAWAVLVARERWRSVVAESAGCLVKSRLCPSLTVHSWASYINSLASVLLSVNWARDSTS